jgi:hypothetical protein
MDSKEIKGFGLIKDLHFKLVVYLDISILTNVVVIDVSDAWGILLSIKWVVNLGGSLQMDLSYATIPTCDGTSINLHREQFKRFQVEDPNEHMKEYECPLDDAF